MLDLELEKILEKWGAGNTPHKQQIIADLSE